MLSVADVAQKVNGEVVGDATLQLRRLAPLETAGEGDLSHLSSPSYNAFLDHTGASAVLLRGGDLSRCPVTAIVVDNPYLAFARISHAFVATPVRETGVHETAHIDDTAHVAKNVTIGPNVVIGPRAVVGEHCLLDAGTVLEAECRLGDHCHLRANVTICMNVSVGHRVLIHSGAVVGADGFGFTHDEQGKLQKIAQLGSVSIGNDVEIGAQTTIDRGALEDTIIEDGVKIDNQVQIGHNCRIGAHTLICGCVGIVGSTRIGRHCVLAGGVGIGGEKPIELVDGVVLSGMTHVSRSILTPGTYSSGGIHEEHGAWKKNALRFRELHGLFRRLARLEKQVGSAE